MFDRVTTIQSLSPNQSIVMRDDHVQALLVEAAIDTASSSLSRLGHDVKVDLVLRARLARCIGPPTNVAELTDLAKHRKRFDRAVREVAAAAEASLGHAR